MRLDTGATHSVPLTSCGMVFVKGPMGAGTKLGRGLGVAVSWTDSRAQAHCWAQAHSPQGSLEPAAGTAPQGRDLHTSSAPGAVMP